MVGVVARVRITVTVRVNTTQSPNHDPFTLNPPNWIVENCLIHFFMRNSRGAHMPQI